MRYRLECPANRYVFKSRLNCSESTGDHGMVQCRGPSAVVLNVLLYEAMPAFIKLVTYSHTVRAVFDTPQEVADPPESSAEPLWGVDSNPLRTPIPFSC